MVIDQACETAAFQGIELGCGMWDVTAGSFAGSVFNPKLRYNAKSGAVVAVQLYLD